MNHVTFFKKLGNVILFNTRVGIIQTKMRQLTVRKICSIRQLLSKIASPSCRTIKSVTSQTKFLKPRQLLRAILVAPLLLTACVAEREATPAYYQNMAQTGSEVDVATAAQMISLYRQNNGLGPVIPDAKLTTIARNQATAMANAKTVQASLKKNQQLPARMAAIGEANTMAVENVSAGYRTLAEAFSGWRESAKHNQVLLNKSATRLGIAAAYSPTAKHKVFWSLVLAGPAN